MKITRITPANERFFSFLIPDTSDITGKVISLGVMDDDGNVAGALSVSLEYRMVSVVSLYILPEFRRRGYAKTLLDTIKTSIEGTDHLAISVYYPEEEGATAFYEACGFDIFEDANLYSVMLGEIFRSDKTRKMIASGNISGIVNVSDLGGNDNKKLERYLTSYDFPSGDFFDPEWSTVGSPTGQLNSVLLSEPYKQGANILWLNVRSGDPRAYYKHLNVLIKKMEASGLNSNESRLYFMIDNEKTMELATVLIGGRWHMKSEGRVLHAVYPV